MKSLGAAVFCLAVQVATFSAPAASQGQGRDSLFGAAVPGDAQLGFSFKRDLGIVRDGKGRISEVFDHKGVQHLVSYDEHGRVYADARPAERIVAILQYLSDADRAPYAVSLISLETGREVSSAKLKKRLQKDYDYTSDPEFIGAIDEVETIGDPFAEEFYYTWGLAAQPPQCIRDDCNTACDMAFAMSGLVCMILSSPASVVCGAVAIGAWAQCRNACQQCP
jgi:hypothetical protein